MMRNGQKKHELFSNKVKDISEFLMIIPLEKPTGQFDARVTYHDPCHLRRAQGVWKQPRALLKMIDGVEFVELPEADWCCGSAGSQLITHYETSKKVMGRKVEITWNPPVLSISLPAARAARCSSCWHPADLNVKVVHPIELLDHAYSNEEGLLMDRKFLLNLKK